MDIDQLEGSLAYSTKQQERSTGNGNSATDDQIIDHPDSPIVRMTTTTSVQDDISRMERLLAEKKSRGILDHFLRKKICKF